MSADPVWTLYYDVKRELLDQIEEHKREIARLKQLIKDQEGLSLPRSGR